MFGRRFLARVVAPGRSPGQESLDAWQKDPRLETLLPRFTL